MFEAETIYNIGQFIAFVILFRYMQVQLRDIGITVKDCYSKKETKELIDLKQAPLVVKLDNIQSDIKEVKEMLKELRDAKIN